MTNEEIAIKLTEHNKEIDSLKDRTKDLENQSKTIQDLVISVRELALNMKTMMEEQKEQGRRLEKLENEPGEQWKKLKWIIITGVVTTLVGGISGAFLAQLF